MTTPESLPPDDVDALLEGEDFLKSIQWQMDKMKHKQRKDIQKTVKPDPAKTVPITSKKQSFRGHLFKKGWGFRP